MINQKSLDAVAKAGFSKNFCRPLYDSYCFSNIPGTVQKLLTKKSAKSLPSDTYLSDEYDTVILLFIDGFGWKFFEKYAEDYPFLKRFLSDGLTSKITTQFPSTTAAHVTCINTGLETGQSGVYEWFYYEPKVDRIIASLLFSYAGDHQVDSLKKAGISPFDIYPTSTFYQQLKKEGIDSYVMQHESISHSSYSNVMFQGAKNVPFRQLSDGLENLLLLSSQTNAKSYFYLYYGEIDAIGHRHGIHSKKFDEAVKYTFETLEKFLWEKWPKNKKAALAVVADHGMVEVDPKTTFYLNLECPEILNYIKKNKEGKHLAPAGSCRDLFLHIEEDKLDSAKDLLGNLLQGKAEVYFTDELIEKKFFSGEAVSERFLDRVGNLVVLPYLNESVWWYEKHHFEQHFYGAHGGATREEMETIFLFNKMPS